MVSSCSEHLLVSAKTNYPQISQITQIKKYARELGVFLFVQHRSCTPTLFLICVICEICG